MKASSFHCLQSAHSKDCLMFLQDAFCFVYNIEIEIDESGKIDILVAVNDESRTSFWRSMV